MTTSGCQLAWVGLTLGAPALAWGAVACAAPIVIHLVLRQRARRRKFPALRFLLESHEQSTRAHRLKHLALLACRMAVILLVVALLSKVACQRPKAGQAGAWLQPSREPVSAVLCIDTSASMGYRFQGRTRVQIAADWARTILQDEQRFPPGSQASLVAFDEPPERQRWTSDRKRMANTIDLLRPGDHDTDAAPLLEQAWLLTESASHPRREVYLFTDLTGDSWRRAPRPAPAGVAAIYILDVGQVEDQNVSLNTLHAPGHALPVDRPFILPATVHCGDAPAEPILSLRIDGQTRGRQPGPSLSPHSETEVPIALPALSKGTHEIELQLDPADSLDCDNRRYLSVTVDELPRVALVRNGANQEVATLLAAMIAPPTQPDIEQSVAIEEIDAAQVASRLTQDTIACILADVADMNDTAWRSIHAYVSAGGMLLIVPGPNSAAPGLTRPSSLLPAPILGTTQTPGSTTVAAADLSHPCLRPFQDTSMDSINDRRVFRRLLLGPLEPDASVIAPFSDASPAILKRQLGTGEVILWAFSPARDWGQFGTQAAPTIVLLQTIIEARRPVVRASATYTAGHLAVWTPPETASPPLFLVEPGSQAARPLPPDHGNATLPTDAAGAYRITADSAGLSPLLRYTVNVNEAESDPTRLPDEGLRLAFTARDVVIAHGPDQLVARFSARSQAAELLVPVGILILLLLINESLFSNRFYGSPRPPPPPGEPPTTTNGRPADFASSV